MVKEIEDTLSNRFDKDTLKLEMPQALENLKGNDSKVEVVMSNTIQPINLFYAHNIVTESIAYIFVNTESKGLQYKNAVQRGESAHELFNNILEFQVVVVFTDLSKTEII